MFDIGFWEVAVIGVLALVILGPERLPRAIRVLGFWVGRARSTYQSLQREMDREFQIQEMRKAGRRFDEELNRTFPSTLQLRTSEETQADNEQEAAPSKDALEHEQDKDERKDA